MTRPEVAAASVFGLIVGQLSVGIPMARALDRRGRRRRGRDFEADQAAIDDMLADWPPDSAGYLLAIWDAPDIEWPETANTRHTGGQRRAIIPGSRPSTLRKDGGTK